MFFIEESYSEEEVFSIIQETIADPENRSLRELIIDPIINILETPKGRNEYIKYGDKFVETNADMLSKEYPTVPVVFPRLYVDNIFNLFELDQKKFKEDLKELLKTLNDKSTFQIILASPTNVIHAIVLFYSDLITHRKLRDSARQQLSLCVYNNSFNHFFYAPHPIETTMAYVYANLNNTWDIVKKENMIEWISGILETAYGFYRTKLTVDMSMKVLSDFIYRVRTSFNQSLRLLANQYFNNMDKGNLVGADVDNTVEHLETNNTTRIRENLIRKITSGDQLYCSKSRLYVGTARLKNVKMDTLYDFAQTIDKRDIGIIIDGIFYVFINVEGFKIEDINSTKFISRITNLPTAIDRAIVGKPIILPMTKKYNVDSSIIKAYICLIATYILQRINDSV